MNLAFTKHITNALIEVREERLKCEFSIPRKLEDAWEPTTKTPNSSKMNFAFTKHITNALIEVREERIKYEFSILRKLEDAGNLPLR